MDNEDRDGTSALVEDLVDTFGDGNAVPTAEQWRSLLEAPDEGPVCVLNLLKLRERADGEGEPRSGLEAILAYGAGSVPRIHAAGGTVLFFGRAEAQIIGGGDEDWDLVVVASYPSRRAFVSLFLDPEYRKVFPHRRAAVARYKAILAAA